MARLSLVGVACCATFIVVAAILLPIGTAEWWRGPLGAARTPLLLYLMPSVGLPIAAAAWVASRMSHRLLDSPTRARVARTCRWVSRPIILGYILTAAFGGPAVHNSMAHSMLAAWVERGMLTQTCAPELETYVSVPLLPGVVFSYAESGASCGDGGGAFLLHFWNGRSITRLAGYTTWSV